MSTPDNPGEPRFVTVSRFGGFAGMARTWEFDLFADPEGSEVRRLLTDTDLLDAGRTGPPATGGGGGPGASGGRPPQPDRFTYAIGYGEQVVRLPEDQLSPDAERLIEIVRERGAPPSR